MKCTDREKGPSGMKDSILMKQTQGYEIAEAHIRSDEFCYAREKRLPRDRSGRGSTKMYNDLIATAVAVRRHHLEKLGGWNAVERSGRLFFADACVEWRKRDGNRGFGDRNADRFDVLEGPIDFGPRQQIEF